MIVDATEVKINRPKKHQLANYSGKKKCHAMKAHAIVTSQGIKKMYSQAQTPRKSSKLKTLTLEDKSYNHVLSKERIKVENIFAKVKKLKIFSTSYRNRRKRFGLRMNLIAGIFNRELGF
ncbi:transposase [Streptococcus pneumoniae]|nr:transposase [Streptococcus pneumoniae]VJB48385.1 transposase [Streptococcus pneumoniae]VJD88069.1 transposase [Streptococcus pneumoniae]VJG90805.1 transposase [Streptococcus pneumoniae]VJK67260.1 transposase [Streptococcus pneumoniae]